MSLRILSGLNTLVTGFKHVKVRTPTRVYDFLFIACASVRVDCWILKADLSIYNMVSMLLCCTSASSPNACLYLGNWRWLIALLRETFFLLYHHDLRSYLKVATLLHLQFSPIPHKETIPFNQPSAHDGAMVAPCLAATLRASSQSQ